MKRNRAEELLGLFEEYVDARIAFKTGHASGKMNAHAIRHMDECGSGEAEEPMCGCRWVRNEDGPGEVLRLCDFHRQATGGGE